MDNHSHVLVHLDPDIATAWSDEEVDRCPERLFPPRDKSRKPLPVSQSWVDFRLKDAQWVAMASDRHDSRQVGGAGARRRPSVAIRARPEGHSPSWAIDRKRGWKGLPRWRGRQHARGVTEQTISSGLKWMVRESIWSATSLFHESRSARKPLPVSQSWVDFRLKDAQWVATARDRREQGQPPALQVNSTDHPSRPG
jgi:hypothetical protein